MPKFCASFTPPTCKEQLQAIGLKSDGNGKPLPKAMCRCFDPSGGDWENIDTPQPNEWLEAMLDKTPDQSFAQFVASRPNVPSKPRNIIYLQPLCEPDELTQPAFPAGPWPSWEILESAVRRFYHPLEVRSLLAVPMSKLKPAPKHRENSYGTQYHAGQVLEALQQQRLPSDAYCMLAVTMCDLYPREEWNFVYGLAKLTARVGVFSFIRHAPMGGFAASREANMLHASMKTMLHEIGHMFGMKHCTWFNCLMRGSNGASVEHQPNYLHLCPVCLHKLQWSTGLDIQTHYTQLLDLFQTYEEASLGFKRDCNFLRGRLSALEDVWPEITAGSEQQRQKSLDTRGTRRVKSVKRNSSVSGCGAEMRNAPHRESSANNQELPPDFRRGIRAVRESGKRLQDVGNNVVRVGTP